MDRISRLTDQLRSRQPNLAEDDFSFLNGDNFLDGVCPPNQSVEEDEDELRSISIQDLNLKVTPINAPPVDGFSNGFLEDYGTEIGK